ncbi:uncharacterized protein LOC143230696 isoform X2 [Tachypleus tridentatus]|uniref:uncharacterized protein LOC143230696 isoform X2 n=1 Tax=Tachypleus tridentatus TaxID=6853 RepID=UPI003FD2F24B
MEILRMNVESLPDEKQNTLSEVKLLESEKETREADFSGEEFCHSIVALGKEKEEIEEKCKVTEEIEKTLVKIKTEQHGDLPRDGIISKFSESDNDIVECSGYDYMKVKEENKEDKELPQTVFGFEDASSLESLTSKQPTFISAQLHGKCIFKNNFLLQ